MYWVSVKDAPPARAARPLILSAPNIRKNFQFHLLWITIGIKGEWWVKLLAMVFTLLVSLEMWRSLDSYPGYFKTAELGSIYEVNGRKQRTYECFASRFKTALTYRNMTTLQS
jgi:hypothetical protein